MTDFDWGKAIFFWVWIGGTVLIASAVAGLVYLGAALIGLWVFVPLALGLVALLTWLAGTT